MINQISIGVDERFKMSIGIGRENDAWSNSRSAESYEAAAPRAARRSLPIVVVSRIADETFVLRTRAITIPTRDVPRVICFGDALRDFAGGRIRGSVLQSVD